MTRSKDLLSKTRGQSAYQAILAAIRDGIYQPGDPLREEEVASRLGVSRTPVREALGRLQEKGLLEAAPGRGVAVSILSMQQIFELYAMREELEGVVARYAARYATDAEIGNLEGINQKFAAASADPKLAAQLNRQFHARLYDAARNRYLRQAVEDLQETIALLPDTTFIQEGRTATATEEHVAILSALRNHDPIAAERAAIGHIKTALEVRLAISKMPE
ncbi:DNA-binding GntR family transcriptional regulator [Pseudorhizobium tarimense]|uniref:DNA-binding GntR family transcriptional regulator n=1 Tax=Pseudorhizobium tarimense TaxID=1079109 RepID=A0ABV2HD87_9HYPH|nr:GntR family transcriptional regulator [Pseudorhizobium tarimense]MCJ8521554.1 GntR family transcriptional regulator [Pseudorhizobium tarimense]